MGRRNGWQEYALKTAAEATAKAEALKQGRRAALLEAVEGSGANYVKAVVYDDGASFPRHVLLYMFTPGEAGERVAAEWVAETRVLHGVNVRVSVYRPCAHALAWCPVVGIGPRKSLDALRAEDARAASDERHGVAA